MIQRVYLLIIVLGVLGGVGYFAYQYYVTTQTRIGILTANNAKLETAHQTTVTEFEQYRNTVQKEIEEFKAELVRQQALNGVTLGSHDLGPINFCETGYFTSLSTKCWIFLLSFSYNIRRLGYVCC